MTYDDVRNRETLIPAETIPATPGYFYRNQPATKVLFSGVIRDASNNPIRALVSLYKLRPQGSPWNGSGISPSTYHILSIFRVDKVLSNATTGAYTFIESAQTYGPYFITAIKAGMMPAAAMLQNTSRVLDLKLGLAPADPSEIPTEIEMQNGYDFLLIRDFSYTRYKITGTVGKKDKVHTGDAKVSLFKIIRGRFLSYVKSTSVDYNTGKYAFYDLPYLLEGYTVIAFDHEGNPVNGSIRDRITPDLQ